MANISAADRAFIVHKARAVTLAAAANLCGADRYGYAYGTATGPRTGTAVVVGSGPSLSTTGPQLALWQKRGALIMTTNAGLKAVSRYCVPDVVVTREVIDVSSHLEHPHRLSVLDLAAAPAVFEAAAKHASELRWFVAGVLQNFELASQLGVTPLFGGSAALTAAVALADRWRARRIVLLGVDLAFAPDGAGYAQGSAWEGYRGAVNEGRVQVAGAGFEAMHAQAQRGGVTGPPATQTVAYAPAYGGTGMVPQLLTWADQVRWLQDFAARHSDIECIDATGAGCRKVGWSEIAAPQISGMCPGSAVQVSTQAALADIAAQCERVSALACTMADPSGALVAVPGYLAGADFVETAAAAELLAVRENHAGPSAKIDGIRDALVGAASAVGETLNEASLALANRIDHNRANLPVS